MLAGQRAGSRFVVGVLSDVDDAHRLRRAGATHLLADIGELPDLLASRPGGPPWASPRRVTDFALLVADCEACRNCRK